jgi:outer membrane protein
MNRTFRFLALFAAAAAAAGVAQAQDNTVKFGVTRYQTHARTSGITGIGNPPGADAQVGSATTVLFTYEYRVMPDVGVELVLGVPPKIKATASGSIAFLGPILEAKNLAPTVLVNYHFGQPGDSFRPYVGAGINYTRFVGISTPYGWQVSLSDSWGPTAQVGVDYAMNKQWGAYASIAAVKVKSDLVAIGANVLQTTIDFRPVVYSMGISYRF